METTTVERALKETSPSGLLPELTEAADRLSRKQALLMGIEREASEQLTHERQKLAGRIAACRLAERLEIEPKLLSPEVLRWRHRGTVLRKVPVPQLALLDLGNPTVKFVNVPNRWATPTAGLSPGMPWATSYYADVLSALRHSTKERWMSYTFAGVIPAETRAKITACQQAGTREIYLLAEAPLESWKADEKRTIPRLARLDPIVFARAGTGAFLVLDVFDPTTLEQYIAEEFIA